MKQETKLAKAIIVTCTILLASASVSWAADEELERDGQQDVRRCEQECARQQPYFEEHLCRKRCLAREREEQGDDRMGVWVSDGVPDAQEEYERCQRRCRGTGKEQWQCQRTCQDEYESALERERERGQERGREEGREREQERKHDHGREERKEHERERKHDHGRGGRHPKVHDYDHCLRKCQGREEGFARQRQCKLQCEEEFGRHREQRRHREGDRGRPRGYINNNNSHKTKKEQEGNNPYYFDSKSFEPRYSTEEGQMKVLQRFTEKSDLHLGIDNFRVGFYEANSSTFMLPHHWDADSVLFIIKGKATMTLLKQENRETFNLEHGDVLMIPAGTTAYLISTHKDEKLEIAELLRPVNTPGHYEQFFGVGGEKSYFNGFSTEILQAALNLPKDQVEMLLKQQKERAIVKASREQMKGLAHGVSRERFGSSRGLFKLLDERPLMSNEHGEFYEVTPDEYQLLEDLDVSVAYSDIKQRSMMAPNYNSRATYVVLVEEGSGYMEMACPHLGTEKNKKEQDSSQKYKNVRSRLSKGDVFIIPAGHPATLVASENEGIRAMGFGINARDNKRYFLAGQDNIINQLDEEAMELSFNLPAREVEEIFQKQRQSYFMAGPRRQQNALFSLLDFAGF